MAFTGTPVVTLIADNLVRIAAGTGEEDVFTLAEGASGTIKLFEGAPAGNVVLPESFKPRTYETADSTTIQLADSVQVEVTQTVTSTITQPIRVVKTGTTLALFTITLTNDSADELAAPELEIYVRFH